MSDFAVDFDLGEVEAPQAFGPLPAGKFRAVVHEVDIRPDYEGSGKTLWVKLTFLDGELKNRKTVAFLDVHSGTDWKQKKGRQQLAALCSATGVVGLKNYAELVNDQPVGVVIGHYQTRAGETKDQVKAFIPADQVPAVTDNPAPAPSTEESPF